MEEILSEGKNFRLLKNSELPDIIEFIGQFLPHSIKVFFTYFSSNSSDKKFAVILAL